MYSVLFYRLSEAESVLAGSILTKQKTLEEMVAEFGESASYALRLLGRVYGWVVYNVTQDQIYTTRWIRI